MSKGKLSGFASTPADLRQIVLSYLCDNCYPDTALVFARDSAMRELDRNGDEVPTAGEDEMLDFQVVSVIQRRKEIKGRILAGQIDEAMEMLTLHFPTVLGQASDRINGTTTLYDPANMYLNLKIQKFVEHSRTVPLPLPSDILASSNTHIRRRPSPSDPLYCEEERQHRLLKLMHELYTLVHALASPMDRSAYLMELSTLGGMLAYPVPEQSKEMRKYLDMTRREAVAELINAALLYRSGVHAPGVVELSVRHSTLVFATLNSLGRRLPQTEHRPPGVETMLSCDDAPFVLDEKGVKAVKEKEKDVKEIFPKFDLTTFLGPEST